MIIMCATELYVAGPDTSLIHHHFDVHLIQNLI